MKLLKWSPAFNPAEDSPIVSVWVGLPGLPVHFFNKGALFSIARAVGNPLKTDESTTLFNRPSVARVCVELDVSKEWPKRLWLGNEKQGFWQDICVENPPSFCSYCKMLGHQEEGCFKLHPSLLEDLKKKKAEEKKEMHRTETDVEARKKKGTAIILPSEIKQVFRPKFSAQTGERKEHQGISGEPTQHTLPPVISLTPFPSSDRIKMKMKETEGKSCDQQERSSLGDSIVVPHQPVQSNENTSIPAGGKFYQSEASTIRVQFSQPLDLAFLGSIPSKPLDLVQQNLQRSISSEFHGNLHNQEILNQPLDPIQFQIQPLDEDGTIELQTVTPLAL